jgi:O-antigen ligase
MLPIDRFASSPLSAWWMGHDRPPKRFTTGVGVAVGLGTAIGILATWVSPLWVLLGLVALALGILALKRSEFALLGILIATSSIIFEESLPMIPTPIGSFHMADILLLASLGLIIMRRMVDPDFKIVRTPLDWPLLFFYGVTLLSTFFAILESSVEVTDALRATRVLSYYLTFFIVTNLVRERRQLDLLLNGIFFLATIVAAAMVVQFLVGTSLQLLPGKVVNLDTRGVVFQDVTRIIPPGWSIVVVSFVTILCIWALEKFKPLGSLKLFQLALLGMAILVTFLRSYWAVLILVIFLLVYLFRGVDRRRLIGLGLLAISSAAMILLVLYFSDPNSRASKLVDASLNRLGTLGKSGTFGSQDDSLKWRMIENGYAISTIASHPLIGLGMGARYRPWDFFIEGQQDPRRPYFDFRKFIHNSHLWILLQSGLLGYLSLMWLSLAFLMRGFRYWRSIANDRMRGVMLGFTLIYLAVLIAALVNSTFMQWGWTPVIGIIMAINEVILRKVGQKAPVA